MATPFQALAAPGRRVARRPDGCFGELFVGAFEFLKAGDVGGGVPQPTQEFRQAAIDVVGVEGRDFDGAAVILVDRMLI